MTGGRHRRRVPGFGVARFTPADADEQVTGVKPIGIPSDDAIVAALLLGEADPDVDAVVDQIAGRPAPDRGLDPRWGCSVVSHKYLGWCANCPHVTGSAELTAWRMVADGHPAPDLKWAIEVSR